MMPNTVICKKGKVDCHFLYIFSLPVVAALLFVVPVCHHCACTESWLIVILFQALFQFIIIIFCTANAAVTAQVQLIIFFHFLFSNLSCYCFASATVLIQKASWLPLSFDNLLSQLLSHAIPKVQCLNHCTARTSWLLFSFFLNGNCWDFCCDYLAIFVVWIVIPFVSLALPCSHCFYASLSLPSFLVGTVLVIIAVCIISVVT